MQEEQWRGSMGEQGAGKKMAERCRTDSRMFCLAYCDLKPTRQVARAKGRVFRFFRFLTKFTTKTGKSGDGRHRVNALFSPRHLRICESPHPITLPRPECPNQADTPGAPLAVVRFGRGGQVLLPLASGEVSCSQVNVALFRTLVCRFSPAAAAQNPKLRREPHPVRSVESIVSWRLGSWASPSRLGVLADKLCAISRSPSPCIPTTRAQFAGFFYDVQYSKQDRPPRVCLGRRRLQVVNFGDFTPVHLIFSPLVVRSTHVCARAPLSPYFTRRSQRYGRSATRTSSHPGGRR
ncbi:uncharacterized protein LY79DRAFT_414313 [Colletotrichum navitas]|uniref:Uncharacterized protein n=1 Tax=Colletotrichum navitas TaxID=681940 RepID=A0AAD8V0I7_9PEZI|nr:uncharacterized protein LY79DRAFT_414313 [Colletotrichum navitas]KAK1573315.1 hypothetical protein LY79DRAFT_414313 [Colletotrichum navitas]